MANSHQFCTFYVAGYYFGINVLHVQELNRYQVITHVPLAPPVVRGLINLRGQIVTALDLRRRLALPDRPANELPVNVIVRTDEGAVSLLVDEIGDVHDVPDSAIEPALETLAPATRELVEGTYKLADSLLLILNTEKTVTITSRN
jgi:purine-binding chemotaxis protein CheW